MHASAGWPRRPVTTVLCLVDGRDLGFTIVGDPDGVPVFAFHGTPGSRLQLAAVADEARRAGVRLVLPDRPGYGYSDYVVGRRLVNWPSDVTAIADHLGIDRFGVIGVSGGGPHALACAYAIPERLSTVTVVSSPAPAGGPSTVAALPGSRSLAVLLDLPLVVRAVVRFLMWALRRRPDQVLRAAARWMPAPDRRVVERSRYRAWFVATARRTSPTAARAAVQDLTLFLGPWAFPLGGIAVPVDIWHGEDDRLVDPGSAATLGRGIAGSLLHMVPDAGHLLFAERAEEILATTAARALSGVRSHPPACGG